MLFKIFAMITLCLSAALLADHHTVLLDTLVPSFDGQLKKAESTLVLPGNADGKQLPCVVCIYPGVRFSKALTIDELADCGVIPISHFLENGIALLFCDIELTPEGKSGNPLDEMIDYLLPQVYHAAHLGSIDLHRVGLMGHSYGGYAVAGVLTKTRLFRAGVGSSGIYDLASGYSQLNDSVEWLEKGQGRMGHHPWENWTRYLNNSPYFLADKIHTPLLLVHAQYDETCSVEESKRMYGALKRLDRKVELELYEEKAHSPLSWTAPSARHLAERIIHFFDTHFHKKVEGGTA